MDAASLLRALGALGCVLGLLAGALWTVRRFDLALPGRVGAGRGRRVAIVERLALDPRRSVVLLRRDEREYLFVLLTDGVHLLDAGAARASASFAELLPAGAGAGAGAGTADDR